MPHAPARPPDPALSCPQCGQRLEVVDAGWIDPPTLESLEPDVAVYILECSVGHGQYEYTSGQLLRPIVG